MPNLTLKQLAGKLNHGARIPLYVQDLKRVGLKVNSPAKLSKAVDTRTSQSSTVPFANEPRGRSLPYGPGHSPVGPDAVDAVVAASGLMGTVGWLNDALHKGRAYAFFVVGYLDDWRKGFDRQNIAIIRRMPVAWRVAGRATKVR